MSCSHETFQLLEPGGQGGSVSSSGGRDGNAGGGGRAASGGGANPGGGVGNSGGGLAGQGLATGSAGNGGTVGSGAAGAAGWVASGAMPGGGSINMGGGARQGMGQGMGIACSPGGAGSGGCEPDEVCMRGWCSQQCSDTMPTCRMDTICSAEGICVRSCGEDRDCPDMLPFCNAQRCVECLAQNDCNSTLVCSNHFCERP